MRTWPYSRQAVVFTVVVLVLLTFAFAKLTLAGRSDATAAERLRVSSVTTSFAPQWGCAVQNVPWRIAGYAGSAYQIEWTVSRVNGPVWVWHHATQDAQDHGNLQVELCDWIVQPGTTRYAVSGVIEVVDVSRRAARTSPPGKASLTVRVPLT
jgi:hypothetical protein